MKCAAAFALNLLLGVAVISDFRDIGRYRLPFKVEAEKPHGANVYFPFFIADVTNIRFPRAAP